MFIMRVAAPCAPTAAALTAWPTAMRRLTGINDPQDQGARDWAEQVNKEATFSRMSRKDEGEQASPERPQSPSSELLKSPPKKAAEKVVEFVKEAYDTLAHGVNNLGQPEVQRKLQDIAKEEDGDRAGDRKK